MLGIMRTVAGAAILCAVLTGSLHAAPAAAEEPLPVIERYVSPEGTPTGTGDKDDPWDLSSTLAGVRPTGPGYVIWMRGGTYKEAKREYINMSGFLVNLVGSKERPIIVRGCKGERATIDGGVVIKTPTADVIFQDIEMIVSENLTGPRVFPKDDNMKSSGRPIGGFIVMSGERCKFINLVIHHTTGIGIWFTDLSREAEVHGCILYDNGWQAREGSWTGGGIALRSNTEIKWATDNIIFNPYATSITATGSPRACANHLRIIGNTVIKTVPGAPASFMFAVERAMEDIVVQENIGLGLRLYVFGADGSKDYVVERNLIVNGMYSVRNVPGGSQKDNRRVPPDPAPNAPECFLRPNKYDKDRANLTIVNWTRAAAVDADLSSFLRPGDRFRLQDVRDYYGKPLVSGEFAGKPVTVPIVRCPTSTADFSDMAAFVLLRETPGGGK